MFFKDYKEECMFVKLEDMLNADLIFWCLG